MASIIETITVGAYLLRSLRVRNVTGVPGDPVYPLQGVMDDQGNQIGISGAPIIVSDPQVLAALNTLNTNIAALAAAIATGGTGGSGLSGGTLALAALTLSAASFTIGAAAGTVIGTIQGQTNGSTLALSDAHAGAVSIVGGNLVVGATPPGNAGTFTVTLTETLAGVTGSPRSTTLTIIASAGGVDPITGTELLHNL